MIRSLLINVFARGIFFVFLVFLVGSCGKEDPYPDIPNVPVNFVINPNSTEYLELTHIGGWVTVTGGYRGIIIYRISLTEFMAYERTCPFDPDIAEARVEVDISGLTAYCPVCHSRYILLDGSTYDGPSHYPLKQYQTVYEGGLLYVYN